MPGIAEGSVTAKAAIESAVAKRARHDDLDAVTDTLERWSIEQLLQREYHGRFLFELVQNAVDAFRRRFPDRDDGLIRISLDDERLVVTEVLMSGMFMLGDDGKLVPLSEQRYDSEELLQSLLATHPDLLAGQEMAPGSPRRWLLISRESGVPDREDAGARWSIDHLFLDQDGVPTLVEVKRSTDSRIRREVVGQMLDYAANAVVYLPVDRIRASFEARCAFEQAEPVDVLQTMLGPDVDAEQFWGSVQTNLQAGRVRLVFVSDSIPSELRRIIEFLNGQMNPAEVYGVEIRQYVGPTLRTLVPRLIGRTADAGRAKSTASEGPGEAWTLARFEAAAAGPLGAERVRRAHRVLDWSAARKLDVWWGKGRQHGGFVPVLVTPDGVRHALFEVWTNGYLEVFFKSLAGKGPFQDEALRRELLERLNKIDGVDVPADAISRRPNIRFDDWPTDVPLDEFLAAFEWVIDVIQSGT